MTKKWAIVLISAATAACAAGAGNNSTAAGNAANEAYGNEATPPAADNAAGGNASGNASGNAATSNADEAQPYRASGTEPFWALTLTGAQMIYDSADGPDVTVATPPAQQTRAGPVYRTPEMTVLINQFTRCTDASGEERHDTVRVTIGTQTVTGCGEGTTPR